MTDKYTNVHNYPPHILAWLTGGSKWNPQKTSRLRVTQTANSERQLALMYKRLAEGGEQAPEDVLDLTNRTLGTVIHKHMEDSMCTYEQLSKIVDNVPYYLLRPNSELCSEGLFVEVPMYKKFGGMTLSGKADIIWDGCIRDVKTGSKHTFDKDKSNYIWQLSVYRMMRPDVITKPYGYLDYIYKDGGKEATSTAEAIKQVECIKVPLYPIKQVEKIIKDKIDRLIYLRDTDYKDLEKYLCSDKHIYFKDPEYKAMKAEGGKRSLKTSTNLQEVKDFIAEKKNPDDYKIVKVTGTPCATCDERPNCSQYKNLPLTEVT